MIISPHFRELSIIAFQLGLSCLPFQPATPPSNHQDFVYIIYRNYGFITIGAHNP